MSNKQEKGSRWLSSFLYAMGTTVVCFLLVFSAFFALREYMWPARYRTLILTEAQNHHFDPLFIAAVILRESHFRPRAVSSQNAYGLMQVKKIAVSELERLDLIEGRDNPIEELFDPQRNVQVGLTYMHHLSDRIKSKPVRVDKVVKWFDGDMTLLLCHCYHSGPTFILRDTLDAVQSRKEYEAILKEKRQVTWGYGKDILFYYRGLKWIDSVAQYE